MQIKDNIAIGDPEALAALTGAQEKGETAHDIEERIREAARLGGADGFLEKLPEGYDTYLDPPVRDHYAGLPEGTKSLFGRPVSFGRMRGMGGMNSAVSSGLSGGQVQRIAL